MADGVSVKGVGGNVSQGVNGGAAACDEVGNIVEAGQAEAQAPLGGYQHGLATDRKGLVRGDCLPQVVGGWCGGGDEATSFATGVGCVLWLARVPVIVQVNEVFV